MILFTRKMHRSLFYLLVVLLALNFSSASSMVQKSQQKDRSSLQQKTQKNISEPNEQKICDGNRFQFLSSYALRKQNDLTKAFDQIKKSFSLTNITYSDRIGRQYKIYEFVPQFQYFESKQVATIKSMNVLNISGGTVRLKYKFKWQKKQIDSFIEGNGTGVVTSDAVSYEKVLQTNETHQLQWNYKKANPITITNSLTLNTLAPYKQFDYAIINQMLNQLKDNKTTVKMELIKSINKNFEGILKEIVRQDDPGVSIPKQIQYRYNDYRGEYVAVFDNILLENTLASNGLSLIFSQAIRDDKSFQCGEKVPDEPESTTKYGGTQQYISHKLFKSSLKNALVRHSLDSTLSQDNWQSRAFQFFVGDLHDAITTTRNISSYKEIEGLCQAIDDKTFIFEKKSITSFAVTVNFTCYLQQNSTRIVDLILPVEYEITPTVTFKQLNFAIKNIKATPKFIQNPKYKITNPDLAAFMLTQTINAALKSKVIGSGFPVNARKSPQLQVRDGYLFLYDKSTINRFEQL